MVEIRVQVIPHGSVMPTLLSSQSWKMLFCKDSFLLFEILYMLLFGPQYEAASLHLEGIAEVKLK